MNAQHQYPLLDRVNLPGDVRRLSEEQLPQLADELRHYLLHSVNRSGGHFAAGLGTIELSVALHYVFNTPYDRLVWDVGHQTYPHKILTGRKDQLDTIRQHGGLSGFPKRSESDYDTFGVGHSSTSISAALGMAIAAKTRNEPRRAVAIIGDGAMTAGMAFEALNHAAETGANLLVILNDNDMSISENVGGLSRYFGRILSSQFYASLREESKKVMTHIPRMWDFARKTESHMKGMLVPGSLFEELGFNYVGPIDGHDLPYLVRTLSNINQLDGPQFLHVVTKKGKGYAPAEADPIKYHAVSPNYLEGSTAASAPPQKKQPTYSQIFGDWLCDMAAQDPLLVGITPAMREGSGMVKFSQQYPAQYHDVAIAEQHSVTFAAGLACEGLKPVVAIYSTFLQRAYDQVIHDVALQDLDVLFAIDRAGVVGADGATHGGGYDISYLRCIPNMLIMTPADEDECRQLLYTGYQHSGPACVRYPRGQGPGASITQEMSALPIGQGQLKRKGQGIAILNFGPLLDQVLLAADTLDASVANMRFVKPLDKTLIEQLACEHEILITVEDGAISGGAGSGVNELLAQDYPRLPVLNLGHPDIFLDHGPREQLLAEIGLDAKGLVERIGQYYHQHSFKQPKAKVGTHSSH